MDRVWALGSEQLYREWAYTALSRHRIDAHLYVAHHDEPAACAHDGAASSPDSRARLARHLARSRGQRLALDHTPPAATTPQPAQDGRPPADRSSGTSRVRARRATRDAALRAVEDAERRVAAARADLDATRGPWRRRAGVAARKRLGDAQQHLVRSRDSAARLAGEVADLRQRAASVAAHRAATQPCPGLATAPAQPDRDEPAASPDPDRVDERDAAQIAM